jgi:hypothetical protein
MSLRAKIGNNQKLKGEIRKMMLKSYGKVLVFGLGSLYLISLLTPDADWEWDIHSSNFGSFRLGTYRVGMAGFIRTLLVLMATLISGYKKTGDNKYRRLRERPAAWAPRNLPRKVGQFDAEDAVNMYVKGKLHPGLSMAHGAINEKTFSGGFKPWYKVIASGYIPITPANAVEISQTNDPTTASILTALNAIGIDVRPDYSLPIHRRKK